MNGSETYPFPSWDWTEKSVDALQDEFFLRLERRGTFHEWEDILNTL